jgi:hypothetical protein
VTTNHIFYIPLVLLVGFVLGLLLGRRSALLEAEEAARTREKKAARASSTAPGAQPPGAA